MSSSAIEALDIRIIKTIRYVGASISLVCRAIASLFKRPFEAGPIVALTSKVIDLDLPNGISNSLLAKLNSAQKANDSVAVNLLQAFISAVEAQRGKQIPEIDADTLITAAEAIIAML